MAAPLCLGYIVARANKTEPNQATFASRRTRLARLADGRTLWLTAAGAVMIRALLLSLSRSGIVSLAGAAVVSGTFLRPRASAGRGWWLFVAIVVTSGSALREPTCRPWPIASPDQDRESKTACESGQTRSLSSAISG